MGNELLKLFATVECFKSECIGWHVSNPSTRLQTIEPISMGLRDVFCGVGPAEASFAETYNKSWPLKRLG